MSFLEKSWLSDVGRRASGLRHDLAMNRRCNEWCRLLDFIGMNFYSGLDVRSRRLKCGDILAIRENTREIS
jgi:hypothetical protein